MENSTSTHLDGIADYSSALDTLCKLAQHSLMLFEQDLEGMGFNSEARYESLRRFLLGGRNNRLRVLVQDAQYLANACPRMTMLLRQFDDRIAIHRSTKLQTTDPFCVADSAHYARRFHFDDPRGLLVTNDPENARLLESRFDEIWENSRPAMSTTTLGL